MSDPRFQFLQGRIPSEPDCAENRVLLSHFLGRGLGREAEQRFRAHLLECAECRDTYRQALAAAARVGRALRTARHEDQRERRRRVARASVFAAASVGPRARRFRLQAVLIPAFLIVLLTQWGKWRPGALEVAHVEGHGNVQVGGEAILADDEGLALAAGEVCVTDGASTLALERGEVRVLLREDTRVLVEDPRRPRLRLVAGALDLEGSVTVATSFGVLRCVGAGSVSSRRGVFEVRCDAGEILIVDPLGQRTLGPGERLGDPRSGQPLLAR